MPCGGSTLEAITGCPGVQANGIQTAEMLTKLAALSGSLSAPLERALKGEHAQEQSLILPVRYPNQDIQEPGHWTVASSTVTH
ncbi:hypothetical protein A6R68_09522 [Neotoma lepida]|uniref:Uncharacterized protein n=1 Tax=Neotoma lepida TaxID=56216 RepID=A0A1A6FZJ6_NEOLE|nr:hypothetical protein A6R68_09522 [Neotoma lepida]